ncbi:MAG: FtsX-like permease family protein [Ruminiclostridium sp.]|nr:FtsX-like permease family protein [Ruminiclostridium sp.]
MTRINKKGNTMYLNILKKDLKRKKTMNVIVLLFVILSAMFAASSVNNIIAVSTGIDYYFEKAGMSDYFVVTLDSTNADMEQRLLNEPYVTDVRREPALFADRTNFKRNGEYLADTTNTIFIMSVDKTKLNYFDSANENITAVERGKAYISGNVPKMSGIGVGDKFTVKFGNAELELEYAGFAKDAFLGAEFAANTRFILNSQDYAVLNSDEYAELSAGSTYYIDTDDVPALEASLADANGILLSIDAGQMRLAYVMSMIVAALLLIVSVCLILVAFVVLRFTIGFTLEEEFREIGVMKAVGIKNSSIRRLYLVKYFGISIVGALIGFICSLPFGDMLLASVSETMVLGTENSSFTALLCCIAVVGIIMLFCWGSTRRIKKMSPIDAVRSGQTGERFRKKSIMHLGKSRLGTTFFLAVNDVISSPKQYGIITAVFAILLMLVMILANTANTLNSEKLLFLFGTTKSDVYITMTGDVMDAMGDPANGNERLRHSFDELEKTLAENGMPGKVHVERMYTIPVSFGCEKTNMVFQICPQTHASDYVYEEGTAPMYDNEIALTYLVAERLGARIGDTVTLTVNGENRKCIITALFQSFGQLGKTGRLHESFDVNGLQPSSAYSFQIDFDDHPGKDEIDRRVELLKNIYDTKNVFNAAEFVKDCTGASDTIAAVKNMILIVTLLIVILIAVLMERSFISREKAEIALMKAVGFNNASVIAHHTLRFAIVALISSVISAVLCIPLTKLAIDPIMGIMGAVNGVGYDIRPLEIFVIYPLVILAITILAAFITSLYTKTIRSSDTADIE